MNISKNKIKWFKATVCLLLNAVILSSVLINGLHELIEHHHESEELCNDETEKDACHRFLVHHEKSKNCDQTHKHLTEKVSECFICKYIKEQYPAICFEAFLSSSFLLRQQSDYKPESASVHSYHLSFLFFRGPPQFTL